MKNQHSIRRSILGKLKPKVKALWTTMPNAKPVTAKKPKRIARRSKQRAKEERLYNARVKVWLKEPYQKVCRVAAELATRGLYQPRPIPEATQCHHYAGRRHKLLLHEPYWIPVSDWGHSYIHHNPNHARELGLLAPLGQWNQMPKG